MACNFSKPLPLNVVCRGCRTVQLSLYWFFLCDDGVEYVLKHGASPYSEQGRNILIAEYLGYLLAKRFNLPIPEYCFIKLADGLDSAVEDYEIAHILRNIQGVCIGSRFIEGTIALEESHKVKTPSLLLRTILGLDQYLYNTDRFPENSNLLVIPQRDEIMVIDYSLAIWSIIENETKWAAPLGMLDRHILKQYEKRNRGYIASLIKGVFDPIIDNYIDTIPADWFTEDLTRGFIREFLITRRDHIKNILRGEIKCSKNINLSLL